MIKPSANAAGLTRSRIAGARLLLLGLALFSGGCALAPGLQVDVETTGDNENYRFVPVTAEVVREQQTRAVAVNLSSREAQNQLLPAMDPSRLSREYRVGPGDILTIIVWDHPELTNPLGERRNADEAGIEVSPEGTFFFPHAGQVQVGGKTVEEVRGLLTELLAKIAREPQVSVRIAAYRSQRVQVAGEVLQPGLVTLDNTFKGVLEALAERGGLSVNASRRRLFLMRGGVRHELDTRLLLGARDGWANPVLEPGDVVRVPDAGDDQVTVLGEVVTPKPLTLASDGTSVLQAIASAGGLSRTSADGTAVFIFRQNLQAATPAEGAEGSAPPLDVFGLDLSQPQGLLLATNFQLRPSDIVYVPATGLAQYNSVIQLMLPTITEIFYIDRVTSRR